MRHDINLFPLEKNKKECSELKEIYFILQHLICALCIKDQEL